MTTRLDAVDVDAARREIGGHEDRRGPAPGAFERALAGALALVPVDRCRREARTLELLGEPVRTVLGAREHHGAQDVPLAQQPLEHRPLLGPGHEEDGLIDTLGGRHGGRDRDADRVAQHAARESLDRGRDGRREEQRLALPWQRRDHAADIVHEAHVEHAIRLVEDEVSDRVEPHDALLHQVEEPSGGRDEDLGVRAERHLVALLAHASVDDGVPDRVVTAVGLHAFADLRRELARRRQDEAPDARRARRRDEERCCSIGSTNAAVLPVPVWAQARRSRPCRACGITSFCTGEGSV